jgi:hypothetical protein
MRHDTTRRGQVGRMSGGRRRTKKRLKGPRDGLDFECALLVTLTVGSKQTREAVGGL